MRRGRRGVGMIAVDLFAGNTDYETGLPHLAHAAACCLMLLDLEKLGIGDDDRWTPQEEKRLDPLDPRFDR